MQTGLEASSRVKLWLGRLSPGKWNRAVIIYTGLFSLWLVLRLIFFDSHWLLALVNFTAEYYFVPLPILALVVLWRRQWQSLIPLVIPVVTFRLMFGELFFPALASVPQHPQVITAMAFNVLWENKNAEAIAAAVRDESPDVVGFEEVHPNNYDGIVDQLKSDYPYFTAAPPEPSGGVGFFSRFPIESVESFPLPPRNLTLHVILSVAGRRTHIFVVHLSHNNMTGRPLDQFILLAGQSNAYRLAETAKLKELISPLHEPVILLCDCNLPDTSQAYVTMQSFMADSYREAGWGFGHTWSAPTIPFPLQRIDYVWHNTGFAVLNAWVGKDGGSDHLPVIA